MTALRTSADQGWRTRLVRGAWLLLVAALLLMAGLSLTARLTHLRDAPYGLEPALAALGIPPALFAWYTLVLELLLLATCLGVATLVAWQRSNDWFALLTATTLALAPLLTPLPDSFVLSRPAWQPVLIGLRYLGLAGLLTTIYLFPNGRFMPLWMRWVLVVSLALMGLIFARDPRVLLDTAVFASQDPAQAAWLILPSLPAFLAGTAAQVYRYRRSRPVLRQQIKWVLFGFAALCTVFAVSGITLALLPLLGLEPVPRLLLTLTGIALSLLGLMLLPLSMALAVLRAGLWDIDLIINRAAVYTLLTAGLTLVYFALTVTLQALFQRLTGEGSATAIVISTLAIAVLFAPLRRRLQEAIDRRFYRRKYNAGLMLERFARRAQTEVELEALVSEVEALVHESVQPAHVSLWLRPG